jgi:hypothetical protein
MRRAIWRVTKKRSRYAFVHTVDFLILHLRIVRLLSRRTHIFDKVSFDAPAPVFFTKESYRCVSRKSRL